MAFFNEIKNKVVDTTQSAVKATKEMAEVSRLNSQISEEQRKIWNLHSQIGQMYFEKYGAEAEPPFDEMCTAIITANEQIAKLQNDIRTVKGLKRCPNCNADIPLTAAFCASCGAAAAAPEPSQAVSAVVEKRVCTHCGAELENGASFCSTCGQKQGE